MANTKISNLTGAASVTDTSVFPVVDSGSTKKVTGTQIKTYARSGLSTVAVSGSYNDLSNKPTIFDGNYNSLTNKPTIPSLTGYATESYVTEAVAGISATTDYNDLTNKPIISDTTTLDGGDFFISQNESSVSLGQVAAQTISIGGSGIQIAGTGGVTIMGVATSQVNLGGQTSGNINFNSPTSGINYNDLSNKPTIPVDISDLTDTGSLLGQGGGAGFTFAGQWDFNGSGYNAGDVVRADDNNLYIAIQPVPQSTVGLDNTSYWQPFLQSGQDGADANLGDFVFNSNTLYNPLGTGVVITNGELESGLETVLNMSPNGFFFETNDVNQETPHKSWNFAPSGIFYLPSGGDIVRDGSSVLGGGASTGSITFADNSMIGTGDVIIGFEQVASPAVTFSFTQTGEFITPQVVTGSVTTNQVDMYYTRQVSDDTNVTCPPNVDTVIHTGTDQWQHTFKLLLKVEGNEDPAQQGWDTQSCEMMIAKSYRSDAIAGSVYGLVYTSTNPLATFTTRWNSAINRVEVLCRPSSTTENVVVRSFVTEMTSSD
jgi:hypothetical protein